MAVCSEQPTAVEEGALCGLPSIARRRAGWRRQVVGFSRREGWAKEAKYEHKWSRPSESPADTRRAACTVHRSFKAIGETLTGSPLGGVSSSMLNKP